MRNKKLIRKGQNGMTIVKPLQLKSSIVDPSDILSQSTQSGISRVAPMQTALMGQTTTNGLLQGGKQLLGSFGGVEGIAGMLSTLGAAALNKNNDLIRPEAQAVQEGLYSLIGTAGPKGQLVAAGLKLADAVSNKVTLKEVGVDRFGRKIASKQGAISPTDIVGNTVANVKDLVKGDIGLKEFGARMARLTPVGFFLGATEGQRRAAREGEDYRSLFKSETELDKQRKLESQQRSKELFNDTRSAGWGTMYAKRGGKLPKPCGCTIEKDGLDTDVFYAMPRRLFVKVLEKVNLPKNTMYNEKIKILIKNSVPQGSNLRSFIESIGEDIKEFIGFWEKQQKKRKMR
ncbi:MAG: hypothetical protein NZZ41_02345 [Candidatus Dojkabacteria bacterium]|nr:hypothetical protein [Candidatus Dojkabacteria bacterium]